jgi:hypothetical protein
MGMCNLAAIQNLVIEPHDFPGVAHIRRVTLTEIKQSVSFLNEHPADTLPIHDVELAHFCNRHTPPYNSDGTHNSGTALTRKLFHMGQ